MFYKPKVCEHCKHVTYPVNDEAGKPVWQNYFKIDVLSLVLVIGIILMLVGMNQINQQCYDILEKPCDLIGKYNCDATVKGVDNIVFGQQAIPEGIAATDS